MLEWEEVSARWGNSVIKKELENDWRNISFLKKRRLKIIQGRPRHPPYKGGLRRR